METPPRFRGKLIAALFLGLFGALAAMGAVLRAGLMLFAFLRDGRFPVRPETPTMNHLAITAGNVTEVGAGIAIGVLLLAAAAKLKSRADADRSSPGVAE